MDEFTEIVGKYKEEKEPVLDGLLHYVLDPGASDNFADDFTIVEMILP